MSKPIIFQYPLSFHIYSFKSQFNSVHLRRSFLSYSLQPHGLQHARLPCPSLTPRACSNSCSLSRWYHETISSSVIPISSCFQSFSASRSFPVSQFFLSGGQRIGISALESVFAMKSFPHSQQKSPKSNTWMQSQKWQNEICLFPRQIIQYHSNKSLCPN